MPELSDFISIPVFHTGGGVSNKGNFMKTKKLLAVICASASLCGVAWAQSDRETSPGQMQQEEKMSQKMASPQPDAVMMDKMQASFTVKEVDQATRTVTLRASDGRLIKYMAGENVRRFDQIKPGDIVDATVFCRLGVFINAPGAQPSKPEEVVIAQASKGPKPGVVVAKIDQMTVDVKAIDTEKRTITFQGPQGKEVTVAMPAEADISRLKMGDQVTVRWTEALAIKTTSPDEQQARPAGEEIK